MRRFALFGLFFSLFCSSLLSAQSNDSAFQDWKFDTTYIKNCLRHTSALVISPAHWENKDWLRLTAVGCLGTGIYFGLDQNIKIWSQQRKNESSEHVSLILEKYGRPELYGIVFGSMYLYGYLSNEIKPRKVALIGAECLALSGISVLLVKQLAGRKRPRTNAESDTWIGPHLENHQYTSFFSGHTVVAFSMATVFALEYKDYPFVPPLVYGLAALTGLSRIHDNAHWASDVFIGAAFGHYLTKFVWKQNNKKEKLVSMAPYFYPGKAAGISLGCKF